MATIFAAIRQGHLSCDAKVQKDYEQRIGMTMKTQKNSASLAARGAHLLWDASH